MLEKILIRNFKCLRHVQINFERFTIFVGPNASGKSSILQAIDILCRSFRADKIASNALKNAASKGATDPIKLVAKTTEKSYCYVQPVHNHIAQNPRIPNKSWTENGTGISDEFEPAIWTPFTIIPNTNPPLPRSLLLHLETSKLISNNTSGDPNVMAPDGNGLHSALASMALNDPDLWRHLQDNLREIIRTIRRLRFSKTPPHSLLFDMAEAEGLEAHQVSEGTLLVLGLLTAIHTCEGPSIILFDDLDRGLHPIAQKDLIQLIRRLIESNPDLQVVATTHSPYLLDSMDPNEVRMTYLQNGATVCDSLNHHPKFNKWKNEMAPGEMWSLFGEKWLVEEGAGS